MPASLKLLFSDPAHFFALGAGVGLVPVLPGTVASLLGLPIFWLVGHLHWGLHWIILPGLFVLGVVASGRSARLLNDRDPSCVVIDEIFGMLFVLSLAPAGWIWLILVFFLFRAFDIFKPWPINLADMHVHGGFGIMLDDLLAGVYTLIVAWSLALVSTALNLLP